jgi:hypothetical protein
MPDRTDIDALLIGALYGELTPADEARLTAHLESHPADRNALADLTRTRAAVRDSRLLAFQLDPPQAISALLLREASRRAPRPERETASWVQRFVRSFMAHPAMAAAAMVVLVVGVAGTLYVRGAEQFAAPKPPAMSQPPPADHVSTGAATETPAPPAATPAGVVAVPSTGAVPPASSGSAAAAEGYRVRLDDPARDERARNEQAVATEGALEKTKGEAAPGVAKDREAAPARAKLAKKSPAIEVRTPEPPRIEPKELGDSDGADLKRDVEGRAGGGTTANQRAQHAGAAGPGGAAAPGGGAAAPEPAPPPAALAMPDQAAPAPADPAPRQPESASNTASNRTAPAKPAPVTRGSKAPPPPPRSVNAVAPSTTDSSNASNARDNRRADKAGASDAKAARADDKPAPDKALLDWARKQKDQVIALVGSNNCPAAANVAVEIYSRAPDFYAANVVTDRSIKPCLAYLNNERERQERSKAAKRAIQADDAATRK